MSRELSKRTRTIIAILLLTMAGAMIGWIYEELFYRINDGEWVRRGQGGPWLPIYAFGALSLTLVTYRKKYNPLIVFLITCLGSFIIEFTTGYVLFHFFGGKRLWDYNTEIWNWGNIGGYVCFRSVAIFGFMGIFFVKWAIPGILNLTSKLESRKLLAIAVPLLAVFIGDVLFAYILRPLLGA